MAQGEGWCRTGWELSISIELMGLLETQVPITLPPAFKMIFNTASPWPHYSFPSSVLHVHFKNYLLFVFCAVCMNINMPWPRSGGQRTNRMS